MKFLFIIPLLIIQLFAIDYVDLYRKKGFDAVQKQLEARLSEKDYWLSYLQNYDTQFGYFEGKKHLIVTDKSIPSLKLYQIQEGKLTLHNEVEAIVGSAEGDKQEEGDLRTPIGVYNLTARLGDLDPKYGPLAFNTSYPNIHDKLQGKNGHGIWIHGLPENNPEKPNTQGCVAINNDKLQELEQNINYKDAVLLISENSLSEVPKEEIAIILSSLYQWKEAWKESDLENYLNFYGSDFRRFDGKGLDEFKRYKKRIFSRKQEKTIKFSDINVIPYPNSMGKKMYRVDFHEEYKTRTYNFEGNKELYVNVADGKFHILTEK